jgi:hypothetical protein
VEVSLDAWTASLRDETEAYRQRRAAELATEGLKRRKAAHQRFVEALKAPERVSARDTSLRQGRWHLQRARGQRERFDRVGECGTSEMVHVDCGYCGHASKRLAGCRTALACLRCRGIIANEKRAKFSKVRRAALYLGKQAGVLRWSRKGGYWSEKLLTLTIPHFPSLGVSARIDFIRGVWAIFARLFNVYWKDHADGRMVDGRGHRLIRHFRNFEWTTGEADELGHPHIHVWFFGPYIQGAKASEASKKENVLQGLWAEAMREHARKVTELTQWVPRSRVYATWTPIRRVVRSDVLRAIDGVIVDVRKCKGKDASREVIKYIFKDFVEGGDPLNPERLDPKLFAQVYESCDGTRITQGSRGLMSLADYLDGSFVEDPRTGELRILKPCAHCHERGHHHVGVRFLSPLEQDEAREKRRARGLARALERYRRNEERRAS